MKSELCPVCKGSGRYVVKESPSILSPVNVKPKIIKDDPCHGCKDTEGVSRGWVLVPEWNPPQRSIPQPPLKPYNPYPEPFVPVRDVKPYNPFDTTPYKRPFHRRQKPKPLFPGLDGDPIPSWKYRITCGDGVPNHDNVRRTIGTPNRSSSITYCVQKIR